MIRCWSRLVTLGLVGLTQVSSLHSHQNLVLTVALQSWAKHLRMLHAGTSKPPTNPEAAAAAFTKEVGKLQSLYEKVQHIYQESPEHQEELRKLRIALEAHMKFLKI